MRPKELVGHNYYLNIKGISCYAISCYYCFCYYYYYYLCSRYAHIFLFFYCSCYLFR